jgi:hypothetical protein
MKERAMRGAALDADHDLRVEERPDRADAAPTRTTRDVPPPGHTSRWGPWGRRAFLGLLALIVVAGAAGILGVKARTVRARAASGGTTVAVHYAQVARASLDVPFEITIHHAGGFHDAVVVAISSSYLELFDRSSVDPTPASETSDSSRAIWTFDPPRGDTLVISVDMQVQSGRHAGRSGTVAVLHHDGTPIVSTSFKTWLVP